MEQVTNEQIQGLQAERYAATDLIKWSSELLQRAGLAPERANTVAEVLVEADLLGHSTHGLQLLAVYLRELEAGSMATAGEPEIITDRGAAITWHGRYLPGPWLVVKAIDLACERIKLHPVVTVAIQQSHHIACLAAYLKRVTDQGLLILLLSSDPAGKVVAPYGGTQPLYTPNPVAAGIPTLGEPIILDISMSTTSLSLVGRLQQTGQRLPGPWLLDNQGKVSDNPADLFTDPPGSILPLGATDLGYKGFALGLLVEALTSALAGHGRSEQPQQWGASVLLQVIDPAAFGGRENFLRETEWLAEACRNNAPKPGSPPVRLPGSRALRLRAEQVEQGVALYPTILPSLQPWSEKLRVSPPTPMGR
ncbi:MAG: lactate dehydrogenase [Chloroflexota bacterium]|nr:MAG: lactate dehydrogenase [Chloroflexota bacterium]